MRGDVVAEQARAFGGAVDAVEQREEVGMQLGDAVEDERGGMALEGEAAEDHRGQVAAVDRQPRPGRQGRALNGIVGSATRTRCAVAWG